MPATGAIPHLLEKLVERDVPSAAATLEGLPLGEAAEALASLPPHLAAQLLKYVQSAYAAELLAGLGPKDQAAVVQGLEPQQAVSLIMHLSEEARARLVELLDQELKNAIRELLDYPEGSVGRIMTTNFLSFPADIKVRDAVEAIRSLAEQERFPASYAYVVDHEDHLLGVLNMRDLMLARPLQELGAVMKQAVFSIHPFMDEQEAASELGKRRYFAAPVVDGENRLLGIVKAERLIRGVTEEAAGDIQAMFGAGRDERAFSPMLFSLKKRLPWLHVNLATAFMAAGVVALFEGVIARLTVLAVYLPVVAGQGGNAGAQSLAVVMRGLVMREIPAKRVKRLILKETTLGAVNGLVIGLVTALVAWAWQGNPYLGLVVGLGMVLNLIVAGLAGSSIPVFMKRLDLDPAQCSSIVLTTVTDVLGFFAFLGLALLMEPLLL